MCSRSGLCEMTLPLQLTEVVNGRWVPAISDPTVYGWLTVAAYAWAAFFCALCARWAGRLCPGVGRRRFAAFWAVLALGLAFMAINKQLDLQGLLGVWARDLAHEQGWYEHRRVYQKRFIIGIAAGGSVLVLAILVMMRGLLRRTWPAVLGLGLTLGFVLIRAASFHHVDKLLGVRVGGAGGVAFNWLFEWAGILLIAAGALVNLLRKPEDSGTPPARVSR